MLLMSPTYHNANPNVKKMLCVNLCFRRRGLGRSYLLTADFTGSKYCCIPTAEVYLELSRWSFFCENSERLLVKKMSQKNFIVDVRNTPLSTSGKHEPSITKNAETDLLRDSEENLVLVEEFY